MKHDTEHDSEDWWTCQGYAAYPGRVDAGDRLRFDPDPAIIYTVREAPFPGRCEWRADDTCDAVADFALYAGSTMTLACRECVEADKRDGSLVEVDR